MFTILSVHTNCDRQLIGATVMASYHLKDTCNHHLLAMYKYISVETQSMLIFESSWGISLTGRQLPLSPYTNTEWLHINHISCSLVSIVMCSPLLMK